jgi:endonuclease/exonuclease/phosphatase family metal-dependent hydrolase
MSRQIRVATYNVHKCRGLDGRTRPERIGHVISQLDADIVALQEILEVQNGRPEFDQVRRIQSVLNGYEICFGENRRLHGGSYGNLTLSRFPVKICENYDITWRHRERRGCLRCDVALPREGLLHVFNVHLGTSFLERRHQARRLLSNEVLTNQKYSGPKIVVGDFNEWTHGLASRLMGEAFEVAKPPKLLRYPRTYPGVFPILHLDHFYYDPHLKLKDFRVYRTDATLLASDHLPLVATFEVPSLEKPCSL